MLAWSQLPNDDLLLLFLLYLMIKGMFFAFELLLRLKKTSSDATLGSLFNVFDVSYTKEATSYFLCS